VKKKNMVMERQLPPVNTFWTPQDLDGWTAEELMTLQLMLRSKMDIVTDKYERELYRRDRYSWMQLKELSYREKPKRDYPFS
jgi:hypothetical protein